MKSRKLIFLLIAVIAAAAYNVCGAASDFVIGEFSLDGYCENFGFEKSTETVYDENAQSAKWDIVGIRETNLIYPNDIPQKWSNYKYLNMLIYSDSTKSAQIGFVTYVNTNTRSYFSYNMNLDFSGWKTVSIPLADFTAYNNAKWTSKASYFYMTSNGGNDGDCVYIDSLWLSDNGMESEEEEPYDESVDNVLTVADFSSAEKILECNPALGVERDNTLTNNVCAIWDLKSLTQLSFENIKGTDMSQYKYFNMLCYSPEATGSKFNIVVWTTEGAKTYKYIQPTVDFDGWNILTIKLSDFSAAYNATWSTALKLDFASNGWSVEPDGKTKLNIERIWFSKNEPEGLKAVGSTSKDIYLNDTIKVDFNNRLSSGIKQDAVKLMDSDGNEISVKLAGSGKTLKVTPLEPMKANTEYTIDFSGMRDYYGQLPESEYTVSFVTGEQELIAKIPEMKDMRGIPLKEAPNGAFKTSVYVKNPFDEQRKTEFFLVKYDADGEIKEIISKEFVLEPQEEKTLELKASDGAARVQAFLCDTQDGHKLAGKAFISLPKDENADAEESYTELSAKAEKNILTVCGSIDSEKSDTALLTVEDSEGSIRAISPFKTSGNFKLSFKLDAETEIGGSYTVKVIGRNGCADEETDFYYVNKNMGEKVREELTGAKTKDDVYSILSDNKLASDSNTVNIVYENLPYANYIELESIINAAADIMDKINNASWMDYDEEIRNNALLYRDMTMYSYYLGLSDNVRGELCSELAKLRPYDTAASFRTEFDRIVSEYKNNQDKKQNGGSGSTGGGTGSSAGGSGRNTSTVTVPAVIKPQPDKSENVYFTDTDGVSWAKEAINALADKNIIAKAEKFRPDDEITRAEFLKLLIGTTDLKIGLKCSMKDVSESDWYYVYAAAAENAGIITGDENGFFRASDSITREDMAVMVQRLLKLAAGTVSFADELEISEYAKESVGAMQSAGIIQGSGNKFFPKKTASRAEAACIIYRVIKEK